MLQEPSESNQSSFGALQLTFYSFLPDTDLYLAGTENTANQGHTALWPNQSLQQTTNGKSLHSLPALSSLNEMVQQLLTLSLAHQIFLQEKRCTTQEN